jgi:Spy/CpxP family protein refolding chaperone
MKGLDMNHQHESAVSVSASTPDRRNRRWVVAGVTAAIVGALSITGLGYADEGQRGKYGRGHEMGMGMGMHGPMDPDQAAKRVDTMLARMVPDATAEQKSKISTIFKNAMTDLGPLREQHRASRAKMMQLLSQPSIDRAALEQVRATQAQSAEQASKRMTQALADAAEVLTPAQRTKVAERFKNRMERMR